MNKVFSDIFFGGILFILLFGAAGCSIRSLADSADLPDNVAGLKLAMTKDEVRTNFAANGELVNELEKNQQLWRLKNDPHFSQIVVGFDRENKVRFVTAFAEKDKVSKLMRFDEIGTLKNAKAEILPPHYRYTWEISVSKSDSPYFLTAYGDNPDFVTMYSIFTKSSSAEEEEEESETD